MNITPIGTNDIEQFLTDAKVSYLITEDGSMRPIDSHFDNHGQILFGFGRRNSDPVYTNHEPQAMIVAFHNGYWLQVTGNAVFETDSKYEKMAIRVNPYLAIGYNPHTNHHLMLFHLRDAAALLTKPTGKKIHHSISNV